VAALGFALLFNVPRRTLAACAIGGAVGHFLRTIALLLGASIVPATLLGAVAIGFWGAFVARRWRIPSAVITVSSAIPLVPGRLAFETMIGLLSVATTLQATTAEQTVQLVEAGVAAITMSLTLGAIALGIALPTFLFKRPRPVV
jgi:uncharacterized membrane protein YjjB (DUF3815 family)